MGWSAVHQTATYQIPLELSRHDHSGQRTRAQLLFLRIMVRNETLAHVKSRHGLARCKITRMKEKESRRYEVFISPSPFLLVEAIRLLSHHPFNAEG
jgi:hypothetical protein